MPSVQSQVQSMVDGWYNSFLPAPGDDGLLKVCTFNVLNSTIGRGVGSRDHDPATPPNIGRQAEDVYEVTKRSDPDIIGLQETKDSLDSLKPFFNDDWLFFGDTGDNPQRQNAVMMRKGRWADITSRHVFGCHAGSDGTPPEQWITEVVATHLETGQRMKFLNNHANSHVDNKGVPFDNDRQDEYRDHMRNLQTVVRHTKDSVLVFAMGDWNVNYRHVSSRRVPWWPVKMLGEVGMTCNWYYEKNIPSYGTHGERGTHSIFDHIYHRRNPQVRYVNSRILKGLDSDHNAVVVTYKVKATATAQARVVKSNTPPQPPPHSERPREHEEVNRKVDYDLVLTADLNFGFDDHEQVVDRFLDIPGIAVVLGQELKDEYTYPRWKTTQGIDPDAEVASEAIFRREDVKDAALKKGGIEGWVEGGVAHPDTGSGALDYRYFVYADVVLESIGKMVRMVCVHMPPRHLRVHQPEYTANLYALLDATDIPWIVGGNWNMKIGNDPCNMRGRYKARWFGKGDDGFAVHPDIDQHVGGDGGKKFLYDSIDDRSDTDHPVVMLRLTKMKHRQNRDEKDHDDD